MGLELVPIGYWPVLKFHVPPVAGAVDVPKCHVSPPRKISPVPGGIPPPWFCAAAQLAEQFGIWGACCHGEASLVPLLESEPFAAM